jgi:hypothetical protein
MLYVILTLQKFGAPQKEFAKIARKCGKCSLQSGEHEFVNDIEEVNVIEPQKKE